LARTILEQEGQPRNTEHHEWLFETAHAGVTRKSKKKKFRGRRETN